MSQWYTVFGVIDNEYSDLIVAAVVEGQISAVDTQDWRQSTRFAQSYLAASPDDAERMAVAEVGAAL